MEESFRVPHPFWSPVTFEALKNWRNWVHSSKCSLKVFWKQFGMSCDWSSDFSCGNVFLARIFSNKFWLFSVLNQKINAPKYYSIFYFFSLLFRFILFLNHLDDHITFVKSWNWRRRIERDGFLTLMKSHLRYIRSSFPLIGLRSNMYILSPCQSFQSLRVRGLSLWKALLPLSLWTNKRPV